MSNYIVAYLTDLKVEDNSESGAGGPTAEVILAIASMTANEGDSSPLEQHIRFPHQNWYSVPDGHNLLDWPHPGVGPALPSGRPWGIPIFSMPEERMRDRLGLTITVLEDDTPQAESFLDVLADLLPIGSAAGGTALAGPETGALAERFTAAITEAVRSSWDEDIIAIYTNIVRRDEDWGIGGPDPDISDVRSEDGRVRLTYFIERIEVPMDFRVRVRLEEVFVPVDLDDFWDGASDVYLRSRVWGGKLVGSNPRQRFLRLPSRNERDISSGQTWVLRPDEQIVFDGTIGPFLSWDLGVWDQDDTSDDDMHGIVFGLWLAPKLIDAFRRNGGRPLRFRDVSRGSHLHIDFSLELTDPLLIPLYEWYSTERGDHFTTGLVEWRPRRGESRPRRSPGYEYASSVGQVFNSVLPPPSDTVPLYTWYNHIPRRDNFTTTDSEWSGSVGDRKQGYVLRRVDGYVYDPARPQPPGTKPLFRWWSADRKDSRTTSDSEWRGSVGDTKDGYVLRRLEGYVIGSDPI